MQFSLESRLSDFIIIHKLFEKDECEEIVDRIERAVWDPHSWYDDLSRRETKSMDPDVVDGSKEQNKILLSDVYDNIDQRISDLFHSDDPNLALLKRTEVLNSSRTRFNRYSDGQHMRTHIDHIRSLFEPAPPHLAGIPVLSCLMFYNDEYEGGEFHILNEPMDVKAGNVIFFPSIFMYPHEVRPVTKGTRYTGIKWIW